MDRSSKQKINKETHVLNYTLYEMDLKTFHPNAEYTFSSTCGTFSRVDHILGMQILNISNMVCCMGNYLDAKVTSKYITRQDILGVI